MESVITYLNQLLHDDDVVVVGISGGPDSMCLLSLLCNLKEKYNLTIIGAHVNHKLRVESDDEALFVKDYCTNNGIIYEYMEILDYSKDNLENEARIKRYAFFDTLIEKYNAKYLMTAHHGDDLVETILMRLVRGSSIKGYSGFKREVDKSLYKIIRPLISVTKDEIKNYMEDNNLKYVIDNSNYSSKYTRNRYRMEVLPFLKKEEKDVHTKFLKFSEELSSINNFVDKYVINLLNNISDKNGILVDKLLEQDMFILKRIIEYQFSLIYIDDLFLIDDRHTKLVIDMLKSVKTNNSVVLPNNYIALKSYNHFRIIKMTNIESFEYVLNDSLSLPNNMVIKKVDECNNNSNYVTYLNSKDLKMPLIVRTRRDGDKMEVKNLGGSKKIKDILIDEKIAKEIRDTLPVVCDSDNTIIWLPGVKKSKYDLKNREMCDIILLYEEEK